MVESVTPNYYAAGVESTRYELTGHNFDKLPTTAVGILSQNNDDPLQFNNQHVSSVTYRIISRRESSLVLEQNLHFAHNTPSYLGAIVSDDGQTIYWVNNTRPLP